MILWFGIFDGLRLVCVEDDIDIARKIALRLTRETGRTFKVDQVEIIRVATA